jgi:LPXTG-motif cell wall-anchored protein
MRYRRKKIGAVLIAISLLIMQIPVSEVGATSSASDFSLDSNATTLLAYDGFAQSVKIPGTVETIEQSAFEGNISMLQVTLPDSLVTIKPYAFWGCANLSDVDFGIGLQTIGDYSFMNCTGLRQMSLPTTITSIGIGAFKACTNLTDITIPSTVNYIAESAFDGCPYLTIHYTEGSYAQEYAREFEVRQRENAEFEDVDQYPEQSEPTQPTQPESQPEPEPQPEPTQQDPAQQDAVQSPPPAQVLGDVRVVGNRAVVFIDNTTMRLGNEQTTDSTTTDPTDPQDTQAQQVAQILSELIEAQEEKGGSLAKYTLVDNQIVADQAFYANESITATTIPQGVTHIGEFAYARSSITQAILPEGIASIGFGAFYHCEDLRNVTLPSTIRSIAPMAFDQTAWVERFYSDGTEDFLISSGALIAYRGQGETVEIPEGVTIIAAGVFAEQEAITSVTLPSTLLVIGEGAFAGCSQLTQIRGGSNVTDIQDRAFQGCPLETYEVSSSVRQIGYGAFDFTGTTLLPEQKVILFPGSLLPIQSHEPTAERLTNPDYRITALEDVLFAVVEETVTKEEIEESVLASDILPYRGVIASIIGEELVCRFTSLTQEEIRSLILPQSVTIRGKTYLVTGKEEMVSLEPVTRETVAGTVQVFGVESARAVLPGMDEAFSLDMTRIATPTAQPSTEVEAFDTAYRRYFHTDLPESAILYELNLSDQNGATISKLGRNMMLISIPVPTEFVDENIGVLTTDANGQLESVLSQKKIIDGEERLLFATNHFSVFALYSKSVSADSQNSMVLWGALDQTPDTGDDIHPKWFLGFGLLFMGTALLLSRKRRRIA